jgi:hypothetical protein
MRSYTTFPSKKKKKIPKQKMKENKKEKERNIDATYAIVQGAMLS